MSKRKGDPGYRAGWCIHYRSPSGGWGKPPCETCEADVRYDSFAAQTIQKMPCYLDDCGQSKPGALPCEKLRRPTPDEIAASDKWEEDHMNTMWAVMTGIRPWRDAHKGRSAQEVVECPACKGRLHLRISSYNGHVHGHCETEGCARWME